MKRKRDVKRERWGVRQRGRGRAERERERGGGEYYVINGSEHSVQPCVLSCKTGPEEENGINYTPGRQKAKASIRDGLP
jgi:hypothetical protein